MDQDDTFSFSLRPNNTTTTPQPSAAPSTSASLSLSRTLSKEDKQKIYEKRWRPAWQTDVNEGSNCYTPTQQRAIRREQRGATQALFAELNQPKYGFGGLFDGVYYVDFHCLHVNEVQDIFVRNVYPIVDVYPVTVVTGQGKNFAVRTRLQQVCYMLHLQIEVDETNQGRIKVFK